MARVQLQNTNKKPQLSILLKLKHAFSFRLCSDANTGLSCTRTQLLEEMDNCSCRKRDVQMKYIGSIEC